LKNRLGKIEDFLKNQLENLIIGFSI
jgi:hypothetical protein